MNKSNLVEIFYFVDEFCKEFKNIESGHIISTTTHKKTRNRVFKMSDSEVITIMILFHLKQYRNLKHFYLHYIQEHCQDDFPQTVSYNRFVELEQQNIVKMVCFLKMCCLGSCTGISFVDSTPLRVCHIKRERRHKTFKGVATKEKSTIGWFFGFKLHLIVNDKGEIIEFLITQAHIDDRDPLRDDSFHKKVFGKLFGDKGYISQSLFDNLFINDIHLITKLRKNMKNALMLEADKICLRKRALIETINDQLKNICQIEHTRHRSFENFLMNLISGLAAYGFLPIKTVIKSRMY